MIFFTIILLHIVLDAIVLFSEYLIVRSYLLRGVNGDVIDEVVLFILHPVFCFVDICWCYPILVHCYFFYLILIVLNDQKDL